MWFRNNLYRLQKEREAIDALITEVDWITLTGWRVHKGEILYFVGDIDAHGDQYKVALLYPSNYPVNPPIVIPREATQRWSTHQYGHGGELCLEWGPDNWHEEFTGADIIRSAYKLLFIENPKEKGLAQIVAPSRHSLTLGQQLQSTLWRFVVNDDLITYTRSLPKNACGIAQFWIMCNRKTVTAFLKKLDIVNGKMWNNTILPAELKNTTSQIKCRFFKTNLEVNALNFSSLDSLISALKAQGFSVSQSMTEPTSLVLFNIKGKLYLFSVSDPKRWIRFKNVDINNKKYNSRLPLNLLNLRKRKWELLELARQAVKLLLPLHELGSEILFLLTTIYFSLKISADMNSIGKISDNTKLMESRIN